MIFVRRKKAAEESFEGTPNCGPRSVGLKWKNCSSRKGNLNSYKKKLKKNLIAISCIVFITRTPSESALADYERMLSEFTDKRGNQSLFPASLSSRRCCPD